MGFKKEFFDAIRVFLYALAVWALQISLFANFSLFDTQIDLIFCSLIVLASLLSTMEVVIAAVFFTAFTSMLLYDGTIYWFYPLLSIIASVLNPKGVSDKFLVAFAYTFIFSFAQHFFSDMPTDALLGRLFVNLITVIALFILVKLLFKKKA